MRLEKRMRDEKGKDKRMDVGWMESVTSLQSW